MDSAAIHIGQAVNIAHLGRAGTVTAIWMVGENTQFKVERGSG